MKKILIFLFSFFILKVNLMFCQKASDILPVELIYFEGYATFGGILLRWGTATEVNNYGFEVQRADTSLQFIAIDFVPGSGNSNSPKHYFYLDSTVTEPGVYFYRLRQIDINGIVHLTDTIQILFYVSSVKNFDPKNNNIINVINNISEKELLIRIDKQIDEELNLTIYSILGREIQREKFFPSDENFRLKYNLTPGVYIIIIKSENIIYSPFKFIAIR